MMRGESLSVTGTDTDDCKNSQTNNKNDDERRKHVILMIVKIPKQI